MYDFHKILFIQAAVGIQKGQERFHILLRHRYPRRHLVTAVLRIQLPALTHPVVHVVSFNGASRTLHALLAACQDKDRPVIALPDPPGNNPRKALVTVRQKDHQHFVIPDRCVFNLFHRLRRPEQCHLLPAVI